MTTQESEMFTQAELDNIFASPPQEIDTETFKGPVPVFTQAELDNSFASPPRQVSDEFQFDPSVVDKLQPLVSRHQLRRAIGKLDPNNIADVLASERPLKRKAVEVIDLTQDDD